MRSIARIALLLPLLLTTQLESPTPSQAATLISSPVSMISSSGCGTASGFCFSPAATAITVGAQVKWTNTTGVSHTATADGGAFDTSIVNPGQTATITFSTPGTYAYHCSIHPDMHGSVVVKSVYTTTSTQQYSLANSDGTTWHDLDAANLSLSLTPGADATALISGNADLWTANAGYNQDLGIDVNGTIQAWKESGGFAGTFSPNAAFVQTVLPMTASTTYAIKLRWKTNRAAPGATIHAGAGPSAPFSPTSLTVQLLASGVSSAVSTQQYTLANNDGSTWVDLDATHLKLTITPTVSTIAILSGNADLWTANAGSNQDLGIDVNGTIQAWKESGGFAGTFSPNAAFVQTVLPMTASTTYVIKLRWKTNKAAPGATIHAGAGPSAPFSPTSLTVQLLASGVSSAVSTQQYSLANSDGSTWVDLDATNLKLTITPSVNVIATLGGNVDLWTANAGYNQDLGIDVNGTIQAWKESGGFAGTFSPNAAMVQVALSLTGGTTYTIKLRWKTNKPAAGATIYAGAGPIAGHFSPTSLTLQLPGS